MSVFSPVSFSHPLLDHISPDSVGGYFACTETRSPVVYWSEGLVDFVKSAQGAGHAAVLITQAGTQFTFAARYMCEVLGVKWVERDPSGGFATDAFARSGRSSDSSRAHDALAEGVASPGQGSDLAGVQVMFGVTVQHRAAENTRLGEAANSLAVSLTGAPPVTWGLREPATLLWGADDYTETARDFAPRDFRAVITSANEAPFQTVALVQRNSLGVAETLSGAGWVAAGLSGLSETVSSLTQVLARVAEAVPIPTVGTISVRNGRPGLTFGRDDAVSFPVAGLIGPRMVRDLNIDIAEFVDEFGAVVAGRKKIPSLVVPFGSDLGAWQQLRAVVARIGDERVWQAFGVPPQSPPRTGMGSDARGGM